MREASKAMKRRFHNGVFHKAFRGAGIDIGAGPDCIDQHCGDFVGITSVKNWDLKDGDAQLMSSVPDGTYDFVHSSHCLEHMVSPNEALRNWVRITKPGGYLVITVPDEEMYEHLSWPSRYNSDHKWSFTIYAGNSKLPKSVNVFDLLRKVWKEVEILKIERIEEFYRRDLGDVDQTAYLPNSECAIEIVLRKKYG